MSIRYQRRSVVLAGVMLLLATASVKAATFASEETFTLDKGQTVDGNLYAFAGEVTIDGTVDGDLIAAGSSVVVGDSGHVTGDVMAAGAEVVVRGRVDGDVRGAGYVVHVADGATVGGELIAAGFSVGAGPRSTIGDDMIAAGYQGIVDGKVRGDLRFAGAGLDLAGDVDGDADLKVDESGGQAPSFPFPGQPSLPKTVKPGIHVADGARVAGNLDYTMADPETADIAPGAKLGGTASHVLPVEEAETTGGRTGVAGYLLKVLRRFVALSLVGALVVGLAPRLAEATASTLNSSPLPSAGWGCLTLVLVPSALVLLFVATLAAMILLGVVTLGNLVPPLLWASMLTGAVLAFGLGLLTWAARVLVARWMGQRLVPSPASEGTAAWAVSLLAGTLAYALLVELPGVGGLVDLAGIVLGIGAMVILFKTSWPGRGAPALEVASQTAVQ